MIVNGVTLPDIPADVLAANPAASISHVVSGTSESYVLNMLANPWYFMGAAVWNPIMGSVLPLPDGSGMLLSDVELVYSYTCAAGDTAWTEGEPSNNAMYGVGEIDSSTYTLVWANHDIIEISAVNAETGEYTYGDVWFAKVEEEPEEVRPTRYSIAASILDDIAKAIAEQRKTDRKYKPEEFAQQIRRMFTLPAGWAESALRIGNLSVELSGIAVGVLPTVHNNVATSTLSVTSVVLRSSGVGILTE